jgi:hypothetical protein
MKSVDGLFSLKGMRIAKNDDDTYRGSKNMDFYDSNNDRNISAMIDYPRLNIKWKDDVEFGEPVSVEMLSAFSIGTTIPDDTLWTLTIPD